MYARRDMRSDYGVLRVCSFGRMIPKFIMTNVQYGKLNNFEKEKWVSCSSSNFSINK